MDRVNILTDDVLLSASIEVQIRLKTDLLVTGEYKMNGVVLGGVINLNRTDNYNITANNLSLSARALFEANRTVRNALQGKMTLVHVPCSSPISSQG